MKTAITVPQLGLVQEVTVVEWLAADGDVVGAGTDLVIVESDKAETTIPAPASGRLSIAVSASDAEVPVGTMLGHIEDP